jgi:DNA repair exonuclease SbcCD ATPase subunit
MQVTDQLHETERLLEQTQLSSTQNKTSSDRLQVQLKDLTQQLQDEKVKGQNYQKDIETLQEKNRQWEADHKQLKSKTEILLKERARILAGGKQITDIEKMLDEYADLIAEVETLQAQKKRLNEDLVMTTQKLAITATSGPHPPISSLVAAKDHGSDALKHALAQKVELERLVADMTETVKSKETQMATIKDVNRQLAEQLQAYRSKYEGDTEELI